LFGIFSIQMTQVDKRQGASHLEHKSFVQNALHLFGIRAGTKGSRNKGVKRSFLGGGQKGLKASIPLVVWTANRVTAQPDQPRMIDASPKNGPRDGRAAADTPVMFKRSLNQIRSIGPENSK